MSESTSSSSCPSGACSGTGTCASGAAKTTVQNGKGDAPRNISKRFLKNYEGIKWSSGGKDRQEGRKIRKIYA